MNLNELKKNIISFFSASKILNNLPDMVLYIDSNGIIKDANSIAKDLFGKLENVTINKFFDDGLKAVKKSVKYQESVIVKTDSREYYELLASKCGKNYCVSIRNHSKAINENVEKDGIEKFNNEKNAFLVKLENEIKSPINSIIGFSQGLVDGIGGEVSEKQAKYLKIIQSNAKDFGDFVYKIFDFSYAESLLYKPQYKNFDIVSEIKSIIKQYENDIDNEKINIVFNCENIEQRNVYNDFKAFSLAFKNVLESLISVENIQVILSLPDDEAFITYSLSENRKYIQVKIKDNTNIFTPEDLKHICNPYAQTDKGKKQLLQSLKLGTASILIKRANGFFSISSENGNLYSIIIPVEKEEYE